MTSDTVTLHLKDADGGEDTQNITLTWREASFCDAVSEIPTAECEALVALYNSTNGSNWANRRGWMTTNTPCSWYGITCSGDSVTHLYLYNNQLSGSIPPEMGDLTNLAYLILGNNQLSGSIPPEVGNLTNLTHLSLGNNQLSGSIPPEVGNLTNLTYLYLSNNQLSGSIPPEVGNLTNLTYLSLYNNQLSGSIPPEVGNLTNLTSLSLSNNQLSGSIPPEMGNLTNLTSLYLGNNQLSGSIPPELSSLTNLSTLWLSYNKLTASGSTLIAFLNAKAPDWANTQTIPPANIQFSNLSNTRLDLSWDPIAYTWDGGYYEVSYATTESGPYTVLGMTENKSATNYAVDNLSEGTTYYFAVRTYTPAHNIQQNDLWSDFTPAISATTLQDPPTDSYEPDDTWELASWIYDNVPQTHSINPAGDEDWMKFTLSDRAAVTLATSGNSEDTRMWLYDEQLNTIAYDDDSGTGLFSLISTDCQSNPLLPGTYYVKVDEYSNATLISDYQVALNINAICPNDNTDAYNVYLPLIFR